MSRWQICHLKEGSIVPCSNCPQTVRLWNPFSGDLRTFKCACCLSHLTYSGEVQTIGCYTNCSQCQAQYKVTDIKSVSLCYVCQE